MPTIAAITLMTTMTLIEVWVPFMTRAKMSRPISSWPNGWSPIAKPLPPSHVGRLRVGAPPFSMRPGMTGPYFHHPGMPKAPIEV